MTNKLVTKIVPASADVWDRTWEQCAYATYFHSREWSEIWSAGNPKYTPDAREVIFKDGKRAILPLSRQKRYRGLGRTYWSSPAGTFGGWISTDALGDEHTAALGGVLLGMGSLRWRVNPYAKPTSPPNPLSARREGESNAQVLEIRPDETHVLALDRDFDAILKTWNAGHRSGVKKAQKAGVTVRCAPTLDDWRAYYGVYEDSVRRWGENAHGRQSWALFEAMYARKSAHIRLWLAEYQGAIISGIVCFYAPQHVVYWHGATLEAHFELGPSKLVMYEAIRHASENGYRWFDFNPSGGLDGVREFKRRFGAVPLACPLVVARAWWER